MRRLFSILMLVSATALAQTRDRPRPLPPGFRPPPVASAQQAEILVKQAMEQLANVRKAYERDVDVLNHLRAADDALVDNMQPNSAIQKAYEEVEQAKRLGPELNVMQGIIKAEHELEGARRSPISADFGHLRSVLRDQAFGPAARLVVRNTQRLQDETLAWMAVQEAIASHVRTLSQLAGDSLRAAQK